MSVSRRTVIAALGASALLPARRAQAQAFPSRTIRIVVPFPAGGPTDIIARVIAQKMSEDWGQPVVVENRPGADTAIGAVQVAKAAPDGYTLMMTTTAIAVNVTLYPKLPFDPRKDLVPVTQLGSTSSVLTVHPSVPVRSVAELVALAKKTRGGLNFGSNGSGTSSHLSGVMFTQMTGAPLTHVPYKGAAPALNALLSGEVDVAFPGVNSVGPLLRANKVRSLAVTTKRRSSAVPDLPTLDSMYPGFEIDQWFLLLVPAGAPAAIVSRLNAEAVKSLQHPDMKTFMSREGIEPVGSSPAEAAAFLNREVDKFAGIVKAAGVKPEP
jgi:tripartite-type tricarboxylate transporter receptor subunit TctC